MGLYPVIRDTDDLTPVSQCLHHFRASDRVLRTVDGGKGTLTRSATATITDTNGATFTAGYHQPVFESNTMSVDGVSVASMTLRLGASDRLVFDHDARPMAMGVVVEFVQASPSSDQALLSITDDAASGARFRIDWSGSQWRVGFHNGTTDSTATLSGTAPTAGQTVRLWGWMYDNGTQMSVQLNQSINSAASTATAISTLVTRATAWATGAKLRYAALGTAAGAPASFRVGKLLPGAPTLAQLLRTF